MFFSQCLSIMISVEGDFCFVLSEAMLALSVKATEGHPYTLRIWATITEWSVTNEEIK